MRRMKKILAWLTVLTVNVSMMPMPTVAAATATDTDASTASSETTTDVTKEATQAQEAAAKAVDSATKAAATTAAKKTTTATKKTTQSKKAKSATSTQSLTDTIEEGIFQDRDQTKIDVSDYDASKSEVKKATNEVLKDNNASKLVTVTYDTNSNGDVETVNVETDPTLLMAMNELDEINDASGDEKVSDDEMQKVYKSYAELQEYYEANPEFFGIAVPYFTTKDAKGGPVSALLSVASIDRKTIGTANGPSIEDVEQLVDGFNQALPQLVNYYGSYLTSAKDQALSQLKDGMTPAEKLLVLNDWLGNHCNFDMADIMKDQKKDNGSDTDTKEETEAKVQAAEDDPFASLNKSTAFGALVKGKTVCMSYTAAYNYLVQCAFSDVYQNDDGSWKTKDEVNGKIVLEKDEETGEYKKDSNGDYIYTIEGDQSYMVDFVRIDWDSEVEMLGETSKFQSPHFFSATKVDGKWYYVDSCYNDIYVECMQRNRVETDGNMTHSYFLVSDTTLRQQFDGNFDTIDTLYENVATDKTYENSWISKAQGPVSYDDDYYYYVKNTSSYSQSGGYNEGDELLVRRKRSLGLATSDGDEVLLNYSKGTDGDGNSVKGGDLVKTEYEVDNSKNAEKYAGLTHSAGLYNNALYFNANNKIFKYDLNTKEVTEVKEYNTVSAAQDTDNEFTGMSFTVTTDKDKTVHTVQNHPIGALAIKDGKMYVSIATNYSYAADYKYEETNYNKSYSSYFGNNGGDNDNQEFMWSANFVDTLDMSKVSATDESSHNFKEVTVDPTCTAKGFTEERCTDADCGIVKADTKKETDTEATGHHYIKANDLYYTKDDDGNRKSGTFYLCTECLDAQDSLPSGETAGHTYGNATAEFNDDYTSAKLTVSCTVCDGKELDALLDDQNKDTQEVTKTVDATDIKVEKADDFDCEKGGEITYVATATIDGKEYTASKKVTVEAGAHTCGEPKFTWSDDNKTCTATYTCSICKKEITKDCTVTTDTTAATCEEAGKTTYTATVKLNDSAKEYTDTKTEEIKALGHNYGEPEFKWADDNKTCEATFTCKNDEKHVQTETCKVSQETTKAVTCTEDGENVYTATCEFNGKTYTNEKKETVKASGHDYGEPTYQWSTDDDGNKICVATFKCTKCDDEQLAMAKENADSENNTLKAEITAATCEEAGKTTYTATFKFNDKTYIATTTEETAKATGHKYGEPTFGWSNDGKTCDVTFTCANNKDHVKTVKAEVTDKVIAPTCTEEGKTVHTAKVTLEGKDYTDTKDTDTTQPTGHKYGEPTYKWSDDGKTCDVVFTCERDNHVETVKAEVTDEVIAPTCTEEGKTVHTAKATFEGKAYTDTKDTDTTKATGHKYDENGVCTVCGNVKPTITLKAKKAVYTGKAISIDKPDVKGDVDEKHLNYSYYSDEDCKNEISEPINPGVYYVRVTDNSAGVTSNKVTLTINPQATKVTSVANASSYVTVSWNKVSKASGYYVYRSTDGKKFTKVATVKSYKTVKYNDKKATKNGQKYVYKVVAYYNGNQTVSSAYSNVKTGYRLSTMKVSSLTNKKGKKLYVKWAKNSKSTGYQIEYVTGKTTKKVSASVKSKSKTISKLKKGKTYYVRIRAYKKVSGTTYYGAWSGKKKVTIKK